MDAQCIYMEEAGSSRDMVSKKDAKDLIYGTCHK